MILPLEENYSNALIQLSAYDYLIVFPFDIEQKEHLIDVFGEQSICRMAKLSVETIFKKFQSEKTIYNFVLYQ